MSSTLWCRAALTNRRALAKELSLAPHTSSAEVVDAAFEQWGEAALSRLRGAWAFAATQGSTIMVARDPLGIMPAYWASSSHGELLISNSIEELLSHGVNDSPDHEYQAAIAANREGVLTTSTEVAAIKRVPPGSIARFARVAGVAREAHASDHPSHVSVPFSMVQWWRASDSPRERRISVDQAAAELRALLVQVMSDTAELLEDEGGNVAAHVSGGLDSTAVAVITAPLLKGERSPLVCVSSWSPDPSEMSFDGVDERTRVVAIADLLGVPAIFAPAKADEDPWLTELDTTHQPRASLRRESHLLPRFSQLNVRHVLSGWGGDEFASFNGRGVQRALVRRGNVRELYASYQAFRATGRPPHLAARYVLAPAAPAWLLDWQQRRKQEHSQPNGAADLTDTYPELAERAVALNRKLDRATSARAMQLGLLELGHLSRRVESWHEAGLRFGVTYHYPLLDVRIVEWALSMPPEVWRIGGQSRRVFRLAVEGILPDIARLTAKDDESLFALNREARERSHSEPADSVPTDNVPTGNAQTNPA